MATEDKLGYVDLKNIRSCYPEGKRMCECLCNALISSIVMGLCVYLVSCFISNIYAELVLEIIVGVVVYVAISLISKNETFCLLTGVLKDKLHIHKN